MSKKRNFSEVEIETITSQVQLNKEVLFGSLKLKEHKRMQCGNKSLLRSTALPPSIGLQLGFEYLIYTSMIFIYMYMYMIDYIAIYI